MIGILKPEPSKGFYKLEELMKHYRSLNKQIATILTDSKNGEDEADLKDLRKERLRTEKLIASR